MFFVCKLGMRIIFVFYMMVEAEQMCFNVLKERCKGGRKSQVHGTSLTPSQTFILFWLTFFLLLHKIWLDMTSLSVCDMHIIFFV